MKNFDCKAMRRAMPDLLFEPEAVPVEARRHLTGCDPCRGEFEGLQGTMGLMDRWTAPEPSPYWAARMGARLREEQAAPARGWRGLVEGLRTRAWVSNHALRPAAGMAALGVVLLAGGGAWLDLAQGHGAAPAAQASNAVHDLQSLNENAQVFQELSALDEPDGAQAN